MIKEQNIIILGGGIAGLTTALALRKTGIKAHVYESSLQLEQVGAGLGLAGNAIAAFESLGIKEDICNLGRLLPSFAILDQKGKIIKEPSGITPDTSFDEDNFTIHRADLHDFLLAQLEPDVVHLGKRLHDITIHASHIELHFEDKTSVAADYLIVADGIHSRVRQKLIPNSLPRYSGYSCWRAVIENTTGITKASETWGPKGRFGIVPLRNNLVYWFACINGSQNNNRFKNFSVVDLLSNFSTYHHPIPEIISNTYDEQLIWNDIIDLKPLNQYAFGRIVLIGDAAHATTPNLGQGACQAIEDAVILARCLHLHTNPEQAFYQFEKLRLKRTHWIIKTSYRLGLLAQLENPFLISIRNALFRLIPPSVDRKQLGNILNVDLSIPVSTQRLEEEAPAGYSIL